MKHLSLPCIGLAVGALALSNTARAQQNAADRQSEAYQASVTQDGLKRDAASIRAELVRVRDQMRQVLPDDAAAVDRAITQMDALSRDEMDRVVQSLRGASKTDALGTQAQALADVLRGQGAISTALKRLAISLDARQSAEGLTAELSALLGRQVAARDELVRLSRRDQTPDRLRGHDHERFDVVNEDQKSISDDLKLLFARMEHVAQNLTPDAQPNFVPAVNAARDGKLTELADAAAAQTTQGPFDQATASQGRVAALLVAMEQALGGGVRPADRLAALQEKLKQTLDQQQALTQNIAGFHERQSVEDQTKRLQTTLTDQIAQMHTELQPLNSQAAAELQAAQDATEAASLNYNRMWEERTSAQENTRNATAHLAAALADVNKQAAALASQTPQTPAQEDAALAALQRDTAQAAAAAQVQAAAPGAPAANPAQAQALQAQVDALQQRALPVASPEAEKALADAATALRQPGQAGAQAAAQQLAQAAQDMAKQQASQQATAQAEAQMAQAGQALAQAEANMASPKTSAEAVNEMNAVRQDLANAQAAAAKAGAPAAAQAALAEAAKDAAQAQGDAAGVQLPQAQAAAQSAQVAMAQAGQGMGQPQPQPQAQGPMVSKAGNGEGKRSGEGGTAQGQGNGGGGKSGDFLAGAGASAEVLGPVSGLNPQDRAAVTQLQTEKPPADFAPEVQQYYKNIADGVGL